MCAHRARAAAGGRPLHEWNPGNAKPCGVRVVLCALLMQVLCERCVPCVDCLRSAHVLRMRRSMCEANVGHLQRGAHVLVVAYGAHAAHANVYICTSRTMESRAHPNYTHDAPYTVYSMHVMRTASSVRKPPCICATVQLCSCASVQLCRSAQRTARCT